MRTTINRISPCCVSQAGRNFKAVGFGVCMSMVILFNGFIYNLTFADGL